MTRAVIITDEGQYFDQDLDPEFLERLSTAAPSTLRDAFTDDDGSVVMLYLSQDSNRFPINKNASALFAPQIDRHAQYLRGDVFIVGEALTATGYSLVDLPEQIGIQDIEDLVRYFMNR